MTKALVTTTIYRPDNLIEWAKLLNPGDLICVAGDKKTPHDEVNRVLLDIQNQNFVRTHYAVHSRWRIANVVGWNSIQRRNVAILDAMSFGVDSITTIDTDNFPLDDHYMTDLKEIIGESWYGPQLSVSDGWFNVGDILNPPVTHRGFPIQRRQHVDSEVVDLRMNHSVVGVFASLWFGDPDIDAMERMTRNPTVIGCTGPSTFTLAKNTWCPFNSQATTFRRDLLPLLNVWPGVGRMDDIWPSFVARHIMDARGWSVAYGQPFVRQERHEHDLVSDLENEIIGYRHTGDLVDAIREVKVDSSQHVVQNLAEIYRKLEWCSFIPDRTLDFMQAWLEDMRAIYGSDVVYTKKTEDEE